MNINIVRIVLFIFIIMGFRPTFADERKYDGILLAVYSLGCIHCAEHFARFALVEDYAEKRNLKLIIETVPSPQTQDLDILYNYAKIYLPKGTDYKVMKTIYLGLSLKAPINDRGYAVEFLNMYAPIENMDWRNVLKDYSNDKKISTKIWFMANFALEHNLTETPSYYVIKGNQVTPIPSPIVVEKRRIYSD